MPDGTDEFIVRRLRFGTNAALMDESTFATERELGGVREEQGQLPLEAAPAQEPLETAGPLLAQHTKGE